MNRTLEVKNLSKTYKEYSSEIKRIFSWFGIKANANKQHHILKNISFSVESGEVVGIVGQNGAGKSTLLKIITGTLKASSGAVKVNGRISAILELGMGFNPDLSGRQNAYNTSGLMGYTLEQIDVVIEDIKEFTELGEYFDEPIRTYSSGMQMRVAFAVATAYKPELLIIDEALSVGDAYFQQKSMRKIMEFKDCGVSILFVSHDPNSIRMLCDSAILIDNGTLIDVGEPREIIDFYQNMILNKSHQGDEEFKFKNKKSLGKKETNELLNVATTGEVKLINFSFRNKNNEKVNYITSEHLLKICFTFNSSKYLEDPHYGITIKNKYGISAFEANTYTMGLKSEPVNRDKKVEIEFNLMCNLGPADYSISLAIANKGFDRGSFEEYLLRTDDIGMIKIIENPESIKYAGCTNLKPTVTRKEYALD